jgi:hypothetical protein
MADITLTLSLEEVNGVMQALGQMPYAQVASLVEKVRSQAAPQVQQSAPQPAAQTVPGPAA